MGYGECHGQGSSFCKELVLIIHTEHKDAILDGSMGHIIVPLDGSESAELILPHALALAKGLDAKLCLVRVTPETT